MSEPVDPQRVATRETHHRLGAGEAEAIVLAETVGALLLIDERLGARIAGQRGIDNTGVCGLLLVAKSVGIITEVGPILDQLARVGFYLSPRLVADIRRKAGEA